ncbi:unnamed protein product [Leptidea sinapis]|uniref:Uncharacterized protein n=1 Tax=Leptidea sinapis TaxID=189913 RepID=A0A5E4R046_9NEOP|nr:unnamed protein product [Leptidea sinapis]
MDLTTRRDDVTVNHECREVNGNMGMASEVSSRKSSSFSIRNLVGSADDRPAGGPANDYRRQECEKKIKSLDEFLFAHVSSKQLIIHDLLVENK